MNKTIEQMVNDPNIFEGDKTLIMKLYETYKPVRQPPADRPPKPTDSEVDASLEGTLVTTEMGDVEYVLNHVTRKWVKSTTAIGKLLTKYNWSKRITT